MFEKDVRVMLLFDIYGSLLSETQRNLFELYYGEDLSLSEISENAGMTRQGVRDSVRHAEAALYGFEEKLGIAGTREENSKKALEALEALKKIKASGPSDSLKLSVIKKFIDGFIIS